MVTGIGGESASVPAAGTSSSKASKTSGSIALARHALASLSAPRAKTAAEQKLDEILQGLKDSKSKAAQEAARQKLQRIKAKLDALKLAAGSAAATGDAKLARKVAKDIRDAARELSRALAEAGGGGSAAGAAAAPAPVAVSATGKDAAPAAPSASTTAPAAPAGGDDLASLKADAQGVLKELKKIMRKLRETGLHPGIAAKDRAEMEKMFAAADRELAGLAAVAAPAPGMAVNLVA